MAIAIRPAREDDIPFMARFAIAAFDGYAAVMYEGAVPGQSVQQAMEQRFRRRGTTASFANSRIAEDSGVIVGGLHAFPMDGFADDPEDPLIPEERYPVFAPFEPLHAPGSYYVNALAVDSAQRGKGIGRHLMAHAEAEALARGFSTMSLHVFAENRAAVGLYEALGYAEVGRAPLVPHPSLKYGGDLLFLTRSL